MENATFPSHPSQSSELVVSVSECIALVNQTLDFAYPTIAVEGEVASFKVNHNNYVFFDLKDDNGSLGCFMTVYQLRVPLEDGMRVRVVASPKLTPWGKFSLTVRQVVPVGEGSLKRAYELLKGKLAAEGLFAPERKRPLPQFIERVAVVSSRQAAGYTDFMKIAAARWPLAEIATHHVRVQGAGAADDIIDAIAACNEAAEPPEVIALVRGGGSADDLACFNDEQLVRAIAASRVPVIAGVGHEVDETLASLAADVVASTPSNAAELLLPDVREVRQRLVAAQRHLSIHLSGLVQGQKQLVAHRREHLQAHLARLFETAQRELSLRRQLLAQLDPRTVLRRGYGIVRHEGRVLGAADAPQPGALLHIETADLLIESEVKNVSKK